MEEKTTLLPFMIGRRDGSKRVPMGDAILSLPIAREGGFKLFLPEGFTSDLLKPLTDVEITGELRLGAPMAYPTEKVFAQGSPYFIGDWGTPEFLAKRGKINATLCWAKAIGMELLDPAPSLRRPGKPVKGKLALFPTGAAEKRSLPTAKTLELAQALAAAGFSPEILPNFEKAADLAAFVASCEYAVGVYTGPMHLAASMGVKTVALPVGDSPWAYRPLQSNVKVLATSCDLCWTKGRREVARFCKEAEPKCVRAAKPEFVVKALRGLDEGKGGIEFLQEEEAGSGF